MQPWPLIWIPHRLRYLFKPTLPRTIYAPILTVWVAKKILPHYPWGKACNYFSSGCAPGPTPNGGFDGQPTEPEGPSRGSAGTEYSPVDQPVMLKKVNLALAGTGGTSCYYGCPFNIWLLHIPLNQSTPGPSNLMRLQGSLRIYWISASSSSPCALRITPWPEGRPDGQRSCLGFYTLGRLRFPAGHPREINQGHEWTVW